MFVQGCGGDSRPRTLADGNQWLELVIQDWDDAAVSFGSGYQPLQK